MITLSPQRVNDVAEWGRDLISLLPGAGLLVVDSELRIRVADGDAYSALTDGAVGRRVVDVVPAPAWEALRPHYLAALDGRVQSFDYEAVLDASTHSLRMVPVREGEAVVGVMVLTEDITARVATSKGLADRRRMERSVLEALDEGVIVIGPEGRLRQANQAACAILGLDLAAARADPSWWVSFAARLKSDGAPLDVGAGVMRTGRGVRGVDVEADLPDGTTASLSVDYHRLSDEGAVSGLVLSFRDVTERDLEHRHLAESQDRLREAHEVARLSSWEWEPATDELVVFQALAKEDMNAGARMTFEDVLAETPPEERQGARDDLASIMDGTSDGTVRRTRRHYPSGDAWLETRARPIRGADGGLLSIRGTTQDVTEEELAKRQAAAERDFLQATLDSLSAHIVVLDEHGEIVMTNRAWDRFAVANGGTPTGLGSNYLAVCDAVPDDPLATRAAADLRAIISGSRAESSLEYPCHSPIAERWFVMRAARFDGPGAASVVVSHDDVTERRLAEDEVTTQAALLDEVAVAVVATDRDGRITHWNRGAEDLYGWTRAEVAGQDAARLLSAAGVEPSLALGDGELLETELLANRKDGSEFPAHLRLRTILDEAGQATGQIGVTDDISKRVASDRALLSARNYMRAIADSMGEGLFTLDTTGCLTYMNEAAESLLGWSSQELEGRVMHDVTHSRHADGSPFPAEDCPMLHARRDRRTLRVEDDVFFRADGRQLPVAYTAAPFETDDGVQGCAVVFSDISERKAYEVNLQNEADKLSWIGRIQEALAEGRFVLYAQPIVDLSSGDVVQSELLIRLREPDGEIVGPAAYLEIAEEYGLIGDIDRWVIEQGTEIAAGGRPVQINLSAHSIGDRSILDHIEHCLQDSGCDPADIVFEITETAIVQDAGAAHALADRLRTLGCKLALDDFGTGYGGFTYLKQLPVDCLKIDIEFVSDLATNAASRHVVEAVVALARGFHLQTVAEGVEDAESLALLRQIGVDLAQGYHLGRPAPLDAAAKPTDDQEAQP